MAELISRGPRPHQGSAGIPEELAEPGEQQEQSEQRVTALELFFDLVFVFSLTQVTGFVSANHSFTGLVQGMAILAVLWFAWSGYAWLGNTANTDEGLVRVILLSAMGAMLIASLAVPEAFGRYGLLFGAAYLAMRVLHIGCYMAIARARNDATLVAVVVRLGSTTLPAAAVLVLAGALNGTPRAICWVAALLVDYGGIVLRGVSGWRVAPGHFAERHSAVVIIALGESIVDVGAGASATALSAGVIAGALLGIATAAALWWAYFDVVAIVAERRLRAAPPLEQARMARDSYTYLHLPVIAGVIAFAIGVKLTLRHTAAHLDPVPAAALCCGVALYLIALSGLKRRNIGTFNNQRLVVGALLVLLTFVATVVPALLALALVTLASTGLIVFEYLRYSDARARIRHGRPEPG